VIGVVVIALIATIGGGFFVLRGKCSAKAGGARGYRGLQIQVTRNARIRAVCIFGLPLVFSQSVSQSSNR